MGGGNAYLGKLVTREEGGPFGADFTKVYTTRSLTTSSKITPKNKCDHIHLFLHEQSIINSKDQSHNKFPIHPDRILT